MLMHRLHLNQTIIPCHEAKNAPLLCQEKFSQAFYYTALSWQDMLDELSTEINKALHSNTI